MTASPSSRSRHSRAPAHRPWDPHRVRLLGPVAPWAAGQLPATAACESEERRSATVAVLIAPGALDETLSRIAHARSAHPMARLRVLADADHVDLLAALTAMGEDDFVPVNANLAAEHEEPALRARVMLAAFGREDFVPPVSTMAKVARDARFACRVDEVADDLGRTDRDLRRMLNAAIGRSPVKVLHAGRMSIAIRLLGCRLPVVPIAAALGFAARSAFQAAFKRATGTVPRAAREPGVARTMLALLCAPEDSVRAAS